MSRVFVACALAVLFPAAAARAEPISIAMNSGSGGFTHTGEIASAWTTIDLGTIGLTSGAAGTFFLDNAKVWRDYQVSFDLNLTGLSGFRVELLDPLDDGDDTYDPVGQPDYVPAGYSTSNDNDGLSFAQGSGLERSAVFAGGSAVVTPNEVTHRGDILLFSGLNGAESARVTFGLRNTYAGRGFLLRISALTTAAQVPEPASMILLGTGLAGLVAARRRRRASAAKVAAA